MARLVLPALLLLPLQAALGQEKPWFPYPVELWDPPFDMASPRKDAQYIPLKKAERAWEVAAFFPHMKDNYWLAVDYGLTSEARRLGVHMRLYEAGGYTNLAAQAKQVREALDGGAKGLIIGAISQDGLSSVVTEARRKGVPVIDLVNGMTSKKISAKSLVSFGEMGSTTGEYIARRHPSGSAEVRVGWFPGPKGAGWVEAGDKGFRKGVAGSAVRIVATRHGDTGRNVQAQLLEEVLSKHADLDYVVGTAVTAEAAVKILRKRGLTERVLIVAYYLTPGVYRGIKRGRIVGAPTDSAVIQGRIAMDQVVRILEKKDVSPHVGPKLQFIDRSTLGSFDRDTSLAPAGFRAVYTVN